MPTYVFRKLVRDGLEQIYVDLNQRASTRKLKGNVLWQALRAKFLEEASELPVDMKDKVAVTNELADLLRIIKDAATLAGVSLKEVEETDRVKTAKKGGFLDGVYVDTLKLTDEDPWNDYYRKEPWRFPEVDNTDFSVDSFVELSNTLGEMGNVDRTTLLPGGRHETDSHHSFSLALIAFDISEKYCPELDANKVVRYALVHDLLEIITGDEDTLFLSQEQLQRKHQRDLSAVSELEARLKDYPTILSAFHAYERLDTPESATVYVLDKTCTIWTHFTDQGKSLHTRGAETVKDIDTWYATQLNKIHKRLKVEPPQVIYDIFEASHRKMREELFGK